MDVRQARPTDALSVLTLGLDREAHLVRSDDRPESNPVTRSLAQTVMPIAFPGKMWLARDGQDIAILEARPRPYVMGWDIVRLAVRGKEQEIVAALLQAVSEFLGTRGVPRLFVRCGEEASALLQAEGFTVLAREYILRGTSDTAAVPIRLPEGARFRMPQDAWPLHQLEREVTPSLIGQVAGLTSSDWSQKRRGTSEIVVERNGRIVGWIRSEKRPRRVSRVGMLVHPDCKELASTLLLHVLHGADPDTRFLGRVRQYQVETLQAYLDAGFQIEGEEILLVKHGQAEVAKTEKRRVRVSGVPTMQAFHQQLVVVAPGRGDPSPHKSRDEEQQT